MIHVALLRGINLGSRRRIAMADLRAWLADLGYTDVRTLLQSGNVVFRSGKRAATVRTEMEAALAERAGFAVDCVFRTGPELRAVVDADPFGELATDPARYLVSFLDVPGTWRRSTTTPSCRSVCTSVSVRRTSGCRTASSDPRSWPRSRHATVRSRPCATGARSPNSLP